MPRWSRKKWEKGLARRLIPDAADSFTQRVHAVPTNLRSGPTQCTDRSARALVNHVTAEHLWAPHLLIGETIEEVGDVYAGDVLGANPVEAWDAASAVSVAAWEAVPDHVTVHLSFGDTSADEYAWQLLLDTTAHTWDLARGTGLEERLSREIVEALWPYASENVPHWQSSGILAPPVHTHSEDLQARLIALLGRDPHVHEQ
ncbi:TIGR03086 family metal-binding protein [Actinopolymorpha pittospori]